MSREQAERAVGAIFADLRDRRFLKWLFKDNPGEDNLIAVFQGGEPLYAIDGEAQAEIREAWIKILMQ